MKIDRLMGIVIYLLNHGRTSAQSLSEEFEVSPRTIVRDLLRKTIPFLWIWALQMKMAK